MKKAGPAIVFFIALVLLHVPVPPSGADEGNSFSLEEFGLLTGYGRASIIGQDYQIVSFMPRWGYDIRGAASKIGLKAPGRLEFLVEPLANVVLTPDVNAEAGCSFLLKFGLPLGSELMWFMEGGLGMLYMTQHTLEQGTQYNFLPQAGAGIHYFLTEKWAFTSAYRFRHLSNAGASSRNSGINANMYLVGFSHFYK